MGKGEDQPIDASEVFDEWINTLDTIVAKYDPDGIVLFCNDSAVKATGLTREELIGRYFPDLEIWSSSEKKRAQIIECFKRANKGLSSRIETSFMSENNIPIPVIFNCQPLMDKDGSVKFITAEGKLIAEEVKLRAELQKTKENLERRVEKRTAELRKANMQLQQEISERKRIEDALQQSEQRFRDLYQGAPIAYYSVDISRVINDCNEMAEELLGYSADELLGMNVAELLADTPDGIEKNETVWQRFGRRERIANERIQLAGKDGQLVWGNLTLNAIRDKDGNTIGCRCMINDITGQVNLEAQLQHAQKMEAIDTLASGIAHDFNNLLMGFQGNASLMLIDMGPRHPYYERLKNIEELVHSGAELTRQLLGFVRGGKYEVKPTDLNKLVRKSSRMFGRTKKEISIRRKYEKGIWTVEVDQGQIEQVLLNLYVNAWQAMPRGGEMHIQTENVTLDESYIKPYRAMTGRYVRISVTDNGVGMDEATKHRIFEPFFTTKVKGRGAGLGLASTYGIIKNHGGLINVYSEKGEGTTFNIYLPVSDNEIVEESKSPEKVFKGTETILLVDDEDVILEVNEKIMQSLGYKVLSANSGKGAVEIYKQNQDKIDIVVLDMIMPDIGGGEAYELLRKINPDAKVILSSGYSINGQASEILARGCRGFIQKPFNITDLSRKLRETLD